MILFVLRIGNDILYVRLMNDELHFGWQAQFLVKLECDLLVNPRNVNDVSK